MINRSAIGKEEENRAEDERYSEQKTEMNEKGQFSDFKRHILIYSKKISIKKAIKLVQAARTENWKSADLRKTRQQNKPAFQRRFIRK